MIVRPDHVVRRVGVAGALGLADKISGTSDGGTVNIAITDQSPERVEASIVGELDADNCSDVGDALGESASSGAQMVVDLSELTFMDSSGISELLRLRATAVDAGGSFVLVSATDNVRRVLEITGLLDTFGLS